MEGQLEASKKIARPAANMRETENSADTPVLHLQRTHVLTAAAKIQAAPNSALTAAHPCPPLRRILSARNAAQRRNPDCGSAQSADINYHSS